MAAPDSRTEGLSARLTELRHNDQVVLFVLALLIGAAAGVAAILFRESIDIVQFILLGFSGEAVASAAAATPAWRILLGPAAGGLLVGILVYRYMPGRRPRGVADAIEINALHAGRMSLTTGFKASLISAVSIGSGASVGREGPVVHLGAALGSWLAKNLGMGRVLSRTCLGCGVAAAVAASFNAPIAGTFFALEVVIGHYALPAFAPIVVAAVTATIVSRLYYGDTPAFILPGEWGIASFWEFPAFALLGLVCAIMAVIFMRAVFMTEDLVRKIPHPQWIRPAVAGLLVGAIALAFPQVLGVGYESTDAALASLYPLWLMLALIVVKTAATAISLAGGFGGGVFSPSLFLGAMVGGSFGDLASRVFPALSSGQGAYTLIGMGAVAGAVLGAPISTILMIFELTSDFTLTIGIMIATAIATVVTQQAEGRSFFAWQLERRGISIRGGQETGLLSAVKVKQVMDDRYASVGPDLPIAEVRQQLQNAPWGELFVLDEERKLVGTITFTEMHEAAFDTSHDQEWTAANVMRKQPASLQANDDLAAAIAAYGRSGEVHMPVVASRENPQMIGVVHEHEVMLAYHRTLDQARAEERGESYGGRT